MSGKVSPKNNLQRRLAIESRKGMRPGRQVYIETTCKIIEVYDAECSQYTGFPDTIKRKTKESPGVIWCLIELSNGSRLYAPFAETPDQIYSTYGNSSLLEGVPARLRYKNSDYETGSVTPTLYSTSELQELGGASFVADIGGIIGI